MKKLLIIGNASGLTLGGPFSGHEITPAGIFRPGTLLAPIIPKPKPKPKDDE